MRAVAGAPDLLRTGYGLAAAGGNLALDRQIARNVTLNDAAQSPVRERANVVLRPMPGVDGATHRF